MKLLNLTTLYVLIITLLVLGAGTTILYKIVEKIILTDVDESLQLKKQEIQAYYIAHTSRDTVQIPTSELVKSSFSLADGAVIIEPNILAKAVKDTVFTQILYDTLARELEPYRTLTSVIRTKAGYQLCSIRISLVETEDLVEGIVMAQALLFLILSLALSVSIIGLARWVWKPFFNTLNYVQSFKLGKQQNLIVSKSPIREFQELNRAVNTLTSTAESTYLTQRQFTENAAHELQTPLAILRSQLENLMQEEVSQTQAQYLAQALQTIERMHRLQKSLLLLSRIENRQFTAIEDVELDKRISLAIETLTWQIEEKQINISLNLEPTLIQVDVALIDIIINNLIANAIRHNFVGGSIDIQLSGYKLQIRNTGVALPFEASTIFNRFIRSYATNGSGLGLAIAQQITQTYNWPFTYEAKDEQHIFEIIFR